ncbi:MAG: hypothetical protein NTX53_20075 [candidate division WOR-3 bacterium]|nr:hypothetical protein [candidate division WOR-3 bacterium]
MLLWFFFFALLGVSTVMLTMQAVRGPAAFSPFKNSAPIIKILLFLVISLGGWFAGKSIFQALFARGKGDPVSDAASGGLGFAFSVIMLGAIFTLAGAVGWQALAVIAAILFIICAILMWRSLGAPFVLLGLAASGIVAFMAWLLGRR